MAVEDQTDLTRADKTPNNGDLTLANKTPNNGDLVPSIHDDPNSPYHLYHGDNGTSGSVTPLLNGVNFISWLRKFSLQISIRNKTGFLDGTIAEPESGSKLHQAWLR